jgi:hypothetical protein
MTRPHDNARPPMRPRPATRRHQRTAHPVKRDERSDLMWSALAFALLAIGASILIGAALATAARSGTDVVSRLLPGWPWW